VRKSSHSQRRAPRSRCGARIGALISTQRTSSPCDTVSQPPDRSLRGEASDRLPWTPGVRSATSSPRDAGRTSLGGGGRGRHQPSPCRGAPRDQCHAATASPGDAGDGNRTVSSRVSHGVARRSHGDGVAGAQGDHAGGCASMWWSRRRARASEHGGVPSTPCPIHRVPHRSGSTEHAALHSVRKTTSWRSVFAMPRSGACTLCTEGLRLSKRECSSVGCTLCGASRSRRGGSPSAATRHRDARTPGRRCGGPLRGRLS